MSVPVTAQRLGPYELTARIGQGGMGEVWKARDTRLNRDVAIKFSHAQFSDRFRREAETIAALNHPNVCTLFDVGPNYLVMEYVEGEELRGPMPLARAVELGSQTLDALDAAHRKGITHRDLKPANILPGLRFSKRSPKTDFYGYGRDFRPPGQIPLIRRMQDIPESRISLG